MGRKREYVRFKIDQSNGHPNAVVTAKGQEAFGVSLHKPSGRFYSIDDEGKRVYYVGLHNALVATQNAAYLARFPHDDGPQIGIVTGPAALPHKLTAVPQSSSMPKAAAKRLSACFDFWKEWTTSKRRSERHIEDHEKFFKQFIKAVGDKPVNHLVKADITHFEQWLNKRKVSSHWYMVRVKAIRTVLSLCIKKTDHADYPFPDGLLLWLKGMDSETVVPSDENKKPLPPDCFKKLVKILDAHSKTKTNVKGPMNKKARALELKRNAIQFKAMVSLALNAALDNRDVSKVTWASIKKSGRMTYMDFPRTKTEWKTGAALDRRTPLLPDTIKALEAWREHEHTSDDLIFRAKKRNAWTIGGISQAFRRYKKLAGFNSFWSFKHLRNVGPTVRRDAKLPFDMSDTILGHAIKGTSRFYTGDADETYLLPLVNAIGETYFGEG